MSRSLNIAILLSCVESLMDNDREDLRKDFIRSVASNHPNVVLKYFNRVDQDTAMKKENDRLRVNLSDAHYKMDDLQCEIERLRNDAKAKETFNTTKIQFDAVAAAQEKQFVENPDQKVSVTFSLFAPDKKIQTIKWCREQTGYGLAEAKMWSEGGQPYVCTYLRAQKLRNDFRIFAQTMGYTGIINMKAA